MVKKTKPERERVTINLNKKLFKKIEKKRGEIPRSTFIEGILGRVLK